MVLGSSLGPEDTLALGGSTGHSNQHGPRSMALGHQHGPSWGLWWVFLYRLLSTGLWEEYSKPQGLTGGFRTQHTLIFPTVQRSKEVE